MNRNGYRFRQIMQEALQYRVLRWRYGDKFEDALDRLAHAKDANITTVTQSKYGWLLEPPRVG
jgi:hypothetical protein